MVVRRIFIALNLVVAFSVIPMTAEAKMLITKARTSKMAEIPIMKTKTPITKVVTPTVRVEAQTTKVVTPTMKVEAQTTKVETRIMTVTKKTPV